jgi:hypothetical protein
MKYLIKIERSAKLASLYGPASTYLREGGKLKEFSSKEAAEREARRLQHELAGDDGDQLSAHVCYVAVEV